MNYNNSFNFNELFSDEKYRARIILAFYAVIFIAIIVLLRVNNVESNSNSNTSNKVENTSNAEVQNTESNEIYNDDMPHSQSDETDNNSIYNQFSFLRLNNYHFSYDVDFGETIKIDGKKYDNKMIFFVENSQNDKKLEYQVNNDIIKVRLDEFESADYPVLFINYFDNSVLYKILRLSKKIKSEENSIIYSIDNSTLSNFAIGDYSAMVNRDSSLTNEIKVVLNNNKICEIDMDLNNFISEGGDYSKLMISLKYDNFAQISDFNIDF